MKYYLNESIKYILSEQFVLNEAIKHSDLIVQGKTICDYIKKLLDELENGTDDTNAKEDALNKIFDRTTSLMQDTRKVNDVEIIKGKAKDYINTIQSLITIIDPSTFNDSITADNKTTAFGKFFAHLNELIEKSDVKKSELTSELSKIDESLQKAFSKNSILHGDDSILESGQNIMDAMNGNSFIQELMTEYISQKYKYMQ